MASTIYVHAEDNFKEVLERDGSFVAVSTEGPFVLRVATTNDWIVSIISELDAQGKINWQEVLKERKYKAELYFEPTSGPEIWTVELDSRHDEIRANPYYVLVFYRGNTEADRKDLGYLAGIVEPEKEIRKLHSRVYERFGGVFVNLSAFDTHKEEREKEKARADAFRTALIKVKPTT